MDILEAFLHLLVSQDDLEDERRKFNERKGKKYKPGQRSWHFAYHLSACSQYKGTRWQVRRQSDRPIETVTPPVLSSRAMFIFCRLAKLACRYVALGILLDPAIYLRLPGPEAPYPVAADFEPPKRIFFRHFLPGYSTLSRSALKRATVLRLHWFFTASLLEYLMLSIGYDILVVLAVALHLDDPGQWDLYGNVMEVFTVRRYWSRWHHLIVYRPLVALAGKTVAGKTANCGGNIRRYIHNWLVFVTSGLMHSAVTFVMDPKKSLRCGYLGATKNYALQPLGMAIEAVFPRRTTANMVNIAADVSRSNIPIVEVNVTIGLEPVFHRLWSMKMKK
ncbi:Acetyltransferase ataH [Colletotrichum orbiculare MAFF 240422]|uniref:Acetyltransferase ataH n=1 Tax=Colletotrichum orbiculare (strain 104-T / ATCC 96160 / CBS 514.97 / LARS 414 / MAFF 240422) TaxID=1213857 RepID=A0A484F9G6_COLOR|nr:Acetyltransferase ataH [Colletotrichum orbiculare MAFF 240422]